jgi:hypothetical protein
MGDSSGKKNVKRSGPRNDRVLLHEVDSGNMDKTKDLILDF